MTEFPLAINLWQICLSSSRKTARTFCNITFIGDTYLWHLWLSFGSLKKTTGTLSNRISTGDSISISLSLTPQADCRKILRLDFRWRLIYDSHVSLLHSRLQLRFATEFALVIYVCQLQLHQSFETKFQLVNNLWQICLSSPRKTAQTFCDITFIDNTYLWHLCLSFIKKITENFFITEFPPMIYLW